MLKDAHRIEDGKILLVMARHVKVMKLGENNDPFESLVEVDIKTSINFNVMRLNCARLTLEPKQGAKEYLVACVLR